MTLREAAARLGVTAATLRQQIANGRLRARKIGRDWSVSEREVERYAREHRTNHVIWRNDVVELLAEARQGLADLEHLFLETANPHLALRQAIESIDYRLNIVYRKLL